MTAPACCPLHTNTCGHLDVCCPGCPTLRETLPRLLGSALVGLVLLVLFGLAIS